MRSIAIIIPAYNEERRIGPTLLSYSKFFEVLNKKGVLKHYILIVINNTTDGTEAIVRKHMKKHKSVNYINLVRGGKGYAVVEGFKKVLDMKYDYIGFVDADSATSASEYYKLITKLEHCDGVVGERYAKGASIHPKPTLARFIAKRLFNFVVRAVMLLPYTDTQCGAKIFKRKVIEKILPSLSMSQWAFDVELLYQSHKNSFRIVSVPTQWFDKKDATINFWNAGPFMVMGIIRLRIINSPFKSFVRFYDSLLRLLKNEKT
ncbi:glycosyltransferase [Candidatus Pacearchaeota archaeon]|nr:glycosyltransferase [Candidatus Pacearchaeota archaeon]